MCLVTGGYFQLNAQKKEELMKSFCALSMFVIFFLFTSVLWANDKPDFNNPDAVLADMRNKVDACSKAGDKCSVPCGYGLKTLKNFLKLNPEGDPSILEQRWQPCYEAHRDAGLESVATESGSAEPTSAGTGATPDFSDHAAVVAGIKGLQAKCGGDSACEKECSYALQALKNFNHPQPHYAGLRKGKWEGCRNKVPGMEAPAVKQKDSFDLSKFVVAGLQLGGNMSEVKDRLSLLKAYGYFVPSKKEYAETILYKGTSTPGPDIIRNYEGSIRETTVYMFYEATADGQVYKINFEQKEPLDAEQVTSSLISRYGKPTKHQGNYLSWGCDRGPMEGFCVKANPSDHALTIWAFSEDIKKSGYAAYDQNVLQAKGVKSGAKF